MSTYQIHLYARVRMILARLRLRMNQALEHETDHQHRQRNSRVDWRQRQIPCDLGLKRRMF